MTRTSASTGRKAWWPPATRFSTASAATLRGRHVLIARQHVRCGCAATLFVQLASDVRVPGQLGAIAAPTGCDRASERPLGALFSDSCRRA